MTAIEILRAASRSVPNEDYVRFMAAVDGFAELIAADKEYDAAEQECVDHHRPLFKRDREWNERQAKIDARCDAAISRRIAALANVGGAA